MPFADNNDIDVDDDEEDDEECNIGGEAEENTEHYFNNNKHQAYPQKSNDSQERHFSSTITNTGPSSVGHYRQSERAVQFMFSTEDDDENFLTLECDENLYDDDQPEARYEKEQEKVAIRPTKMKQSFIDVTNKTSHSKEKPVLKDAVNDTIPDFGFIGNEKKLSVEIQQPKKKDAKMSEEKVPQKATTNRKVKIKKDSMKNNENADPFISISEKQTSKKEVKQKSVEKASNNMSEEDLEMNLMGSIAAQYIPDCIFGDESGYNDDYPNNNFLFNQLE